MKNYYQQLYTSQGQIGPPDLLSDFLNSKTRRCLTKYSSVLMKSKRKYFGITAVASMRRTEALASVKFYQILSIFIFFIRLIILEDFIRLISYNGPCVRLGCSFFLATALGMTAILRSAERRFFVKHGLVKAFKESKTSSMLTITFYLSKTLKILSTFVVHF